MYRESRVFKSGSGSEVEIHHTRRTCIDRRAYPRLFVRDVLRNRVTKLDDDEFPKIFTFPDIPSAQAEGGTSHAIGMPPLMSAEMSAKHLLANVIRMLLP